MKWGQWQESPAVLRSDCDLAPYMAGLSPVQMAFGREQSVLALLCTCCSHATPAGLRHWVTLESLQDCGLWG